MSNEQNKMAVMPTGKLQNFLMMPMNGLGQAAIPIVGYNYGAKNYDRIRQARKCSVRAGVVMA
ncbi:MAG: hypothetical protein LUC83_04895 [Clostridiales bacterium]|nr:hypothetical protein [Clostridiales bacterium]